MPYSQYMKFDLCKIVYKEITEHDQKILAQNGAVVSKS